MSRASVDIFLVRAQLLPQTGERLMSSSIPAPIHPQVPPAQKIPLKFPFSVQQHNHWYSWLASCHIYRNLHKWNACKAERLKARLTRHTSFGKVGILTQFQGVFRQFRLYVQSPECNPRGSCGNCISSFGMPKWPPQCFKQGHRRALCVPVVLSESARQNWTRTAVCSFKTHFSMLIVKICGDAPGCCVGKG